ncbi:hypothetical protein U4E84_11780 [Halorubrum sp. AD140]|uniref:hypothetical protein n=1 Tax=Halorubrum sp. AD140 TaxID=3050073 RepID=UPI002ACCB51A|nr:hypothetical protein [Halorubrum sp. AD140]MDZ5812021.1 hypothetical protein [Halorubrum sp. AD140]
MTAPAPDERDRAAGDRSEGPALRRELLASVRALDLLVLLAVPAVLVAVFALPESTRRSLAFAYADPTLRSAFVAHYVHLDAGHLAGNVVGYCLLAGTGYALAVLGGARRFFLTALATFLAAFPFVLSALNLAVPRDAIGFGFSGINMALAGLLPLLLWAYARERFVPNASLGALPAAFFALAGWIALLALPLPDPTSDVDLAGLAGLATGVAGALLSVLYASSSGIRLRETARDGVRTVASRPGEGDLFAVGVVLVVGYPIVGFPGDPTGAGSVVNLYVHLLGFCLAFIGPFALLAVGVFDE